jgi:adenosylmethionine-8-amino-7-oxononanoate aminotransferase
VLIEPFVLGPGGIIPQPDGYPERVLKAANAPVPVIFDEVAVSMRAGSEHFSHSSNSRQNCGPISCVSRKA